MENQEWYTDENGVSLFPLHLMQDYHVREELRAYAETGIKMGYGNVCTGFRILEKLDYDRFEKSIRRVIAENDQLRAICVQDGDTFYQKILKEYSFQLKIIKAKGETREEKYQYAMEYSTKVGSQAIDFFHDVSYKMFLIQIAENDNLFMLIAHHWIGDGTSIGLIINDVFTYYLYPETSTAKKASYIDYVKDMEAFRCSAKGQKQKQYWEKELDGYEPFDLDVINFGEMSDGVDKVMAIPVKLTEIIAQRYHVSNFCVFNTALHIAISLFTGKYDVVIGSASANRSLKYRGTIGFFARPVLLRLTIRDDSERLSNLVLQIADKFSKGLANIKMADHLDFVQFANPYQNFTAKGIKILDEVSVEWVNINNVRAIHAAVISVQETNGNHVIITMGNGKIVTRTFLQALKKNLYCILEVLAEHPNATVLDVKKRLESEKIREGDNS